VPRLCDLDLGDNLGPGSAQRHCAPQRVRDTHRFPDHRFEGCALEA